MCISILAASKVVEQAPSSEDSLVLDGANENLGSILQGWIAPVALWVEGVEVERRMAWKEQAAESGETAPLARTFA